MDKFGICKKCKWVYFFVSRQYAENEVKKFNEYFETLSDDKKKDYYGGKGSNIKSYEFCHCGESYKNFRDALNSEVPSGSTVSPIIKWEKPEVFQKELKAIILDKKE